MLVYGRNVAKEVLKNNKKVYKIIIREDFDDKSIISLIEKGNYNIESLSKKEFSKFDKYSHQGIILDIEDFNYTDYEEFLSVDNAKIVILDHIEDPHNLGAIIRTCEAAGVDGIIIPNDREVDVNPTVIKTSVGTAYDVNIVKVVNLVDTIKTLKDNGYWIVGTSLDTDTDYKNVDYSGNICLVIGNEGKGMSHLVSKNCDYNVKIPMYGKTNSLNASVAAGIMIYEIIGNRKR